jgi:carbon storage regulator CsrA
MMTIPTIAEAVTAHAAVPYKAKLGGLCLSRKVDEAIYIGDPGYEIIVRVTRTDSRGCRLVITAPPEMKILREELVLAARLGGAQ